MESAAHEPWKLNWNEIIAASSNTETELRSSGLVMKEKNSWGSFRRVFNKNYSFW